MSEYDRQAAELTKSILSLPEELRSQLLSSMTWENVKKRLPKSVQFALGAGTGAGSTVAGGIAGLAGGAGTVLGDGPEWQGQDWLHRTQDQFTFQPTSEHAQRGLEIAGMPGEAVRWAGNKLGDPVAERFGPLAGTAANIVPDAASMLLGGGTRAFSSAGKAIADAPRVPAGSLAKQEGAINPKRAQAIVDRTLDPKHGGTTVDLETGKLIEHGNAVAEQVPMLRLRKETPQTIIPQKNFNVRTLNRALDTDPRLKGAKTFGTWLNDGNVYLDPANIWDSPFAARLETQRGDQLKYFNLQTGKEQRGGLDAWERVALDRDEAKQKLPLKVGTKPTVAGKTVGKAFPDVYADPRTIVARAAAQAAPESPAMKELFDVTRSDLDAETLLKQDLGRAANIYMPTRAPAHVPQITVPANAQRLSDVLELAGNEPKLAGSYGWYMNDPLYHRFVKVLGPVEGSYAYDRFHQLGSGMSPGSEVPLEILRSSAAYTMDRNNQLSNFLNPANLPPNAGHIYHGSAHSSAVNRLQNTGDFLSPVLSDAPKTRIYYPSRTGENYYWPTGDAHFVRALGAPDVRPLVQVPGAPKGVKGPNAASVSAPEAATLGEWFAHDVAGPLGMAGSPAQALQWNAFAPATGVTSPLSAPFLELFSEQVRKASQRKGTKINDELDDWIRGKGDYLGLNKSQLLQQPMADVA